MFPSLSEPSAQIAREFVKLISATMGPFPQRNRRPSGRVTIMAFEEAYTRASSRRNCEGAGEYSERASGTAGAVLPVATGCGGFPAPFGLGCVLSWPICIGRALHRTVLIYQIPA